MCVRGADTRAFIVGEKWVQNLDARLINLERGECGSGDYKWGWDF